MTTPAQAAAATEAARRLLEACQSDGRRLAEYEPAGVLWIITHLLGALDR